MSASHRVLAVFAHPDDIELVCLGALARMVAARWDVHVLELSDGEASSSARAVQRRAESETIASLVGYSLISQSLPDGKLRYDLETISIISEHIAKLTPELVMTHFPQDHGLGHQDHYAVASATINASRRSRSVRTVLCAEPPTHVTGFTPNCFIDITDFLQVKKQAVDLLRSECQKSYVSPRQVEVRSHWWATQAMPCDFEQGRSFEAYQILRHVVGKSQTLDVCAIHDLA